ncbi:MAG: hypothetical protein IBX72_01325 [Nitrospirae bacterium]|jgi:hypothetical protein|nr:hypothetical protein [Nitrospirota bacterium]
MGKEYFFDKPKNVKRLLLGFYIFLFVILIAEFFIHKHIFFRWERYPFFYAMFGFVAFVGLIIAAKYILRPVIKRREDYYD